MGVGRWPVDRLVSEIELLAVRGLPREQYYREVADRLRRVIDCDATCWHTLDPETRVMTGDAPHELIEQGVFTPETAPAAGALIVASEYLREDVNTFAALAGRRVPVGILTETTRGHPERSARYRELLAPSGIPFELRAAFVSRGRSWGAVHIARREEKGDFTREDADALARVTAAIADGIRTSVRFDAARHPDDPAAPGLVVLGASNDVELITPPARELFTELRSPVVAETDETPPTALLALASFARSRPADADRQPAVVAVPSSSGWITLHASLPEGHGDGRVAIVLERSASPHATAVRLEANGVTPREREVAVLLAQGLSNPEIAARLVLSPFTVQDHIKNLYEKTGVASRQELVARIFLDDYMPQILQQTPLTSAGGFAKHEHTRA
jgi:DNA-binding CsgD family transcriptional regulator